MPDAYTSGKLGLIEPQAGNYSGTWDQPLYANWQTIDAALGGVKTIVLSSSDVTLTIPKFPASSDPPSVATSAQNLVLNLTGAVSANVAVRLPPVGGMWIVYNGTTGTSNVSIKTTGVGANSIVLPRGYSSFIVSDGYTVSWADNGNIAANVPQSVPAGVISPFGGTVAPSGYLPCDGSVVSQTTYAALYAAISTTWNTGGEGAGNFRLPDLSNMFLRGTGTSGVGVYEADDFKSHTHTPTVTDPGHNHTTAVLATTNSIGNGDVVTGVTGTGYQTIAGALTTTKTTGVTVANATTGGTETRPVNKRVLYIIKT
jgi:microcystin-dependent protein